MNRNKKIIKTSIIGIIVNTILVIFKSVVGLATNSIAIILDAINNLSDVLSSTITIIGTKLSNKKPDKHHPYGHGRIEYLSATINDMIGIRADSELTKSLRKTIMEFKEVLGVYDVNIHNYGPNKIIASVHIQLDDNMNVRDVHRLSRRIELKVYEKYGILLTTGVYASNETGKFKDIKTYLVNLLNNYENLIQMHGFYVDEEEKLISFDLIFNFDELDAEKKVEEIKNKMKEKYPEYNFYIIIDTDISD